MTLRNFWQEFIWPLLRGLVVALAITVLGLTIAFGVVWLLSGRAGAASPQFCQVFAPAGPPS